MNARHVIGVRLKKSGSLLFGLFLLAGSAFAGGPGRETASQKYPPAVDQRSCFQRAFGRIEMDKALALSRSPKDVCEQVARHVSYRSDHEDRWVSAAETWRMARGDCEDFAIVVQHMCAELGVEASIYVFFPSGHEDAGHAVAVGQWMGRFWLSSNGSYQESDSFDGIRSLVAREMRRDPEELWYSVLDARGTERFIARDRVLAAATF